MPARPSPPPPPPRKKGSKTEPPKLRKVEKHDDDDEVARKRVEEELSKPSLAQPADDGDDPTKGEWLFKQNEMVLGPVTAIVLVERIKAGELSADTPIARDGQPFKPMKLVPLFREAYEATLERKRRVEEERAHAAKVRNARIVSVLLYSFMILVPAGGGAVAGRTVMILQPWDKTPEWIGKAPPLVDLPPKPPEVIAKKEAPPATNSGNDTADEDHDNGGDGNKAKHVGGTHKKNDGKKEEPGKKEDPKEEPGKKEEPQTFVKELTNEQAIAPLKDPSVKGALGGCFRAEVEGNPDMPVPLNLAYTITEEGRAANVEITNREERGRPIQECVKKALALGRWPRFEGERKNVQVPFNIKKPPKPTTTGPVEGKPK